MLNLYQSTSNRSAGAPQLLVAILGHLKLVIEADLSPVMLRNVPQHGPRTRYLWYDHLLGLANWIFQLV